MSFISIMTHTSCILSSFCMLTTYYSTCSPPALLPDCVRYLYHLRALLFSGESINRRTSTIQAHLRQVVLDQNCPVANPVDSHARQSSTMHTRHPSSAPKATPCDQLRPCESSVQSLHTCANESLNCKTKSSNFKENEAPSYPTCHRQHFPSVNNIKHSDRGKQKPRLRSQPLGRLCWGEETAP